MRCFLVCSGLALGLFSLVGCGAGGGISGSSYNPGYGPFDERGNYVEAWADKPAKKHWWAKKPATTTPTKSTTPEKTPPAIAANTPRQAPPLPTKSAPTVAKVERPAARTSQTPKPVYTPPQAAKPKPVVVKPKPPTRRHVVKKGDTLYGLSRKYGTSVASIQRANGLKGTTIVLGKSLVIPR